MAVSLYMIYQCKMSSSDVSCDISIQKDTTYLLNREAF